MDRKEAEVEFLPMPIQGTNAPLDPTGQAFNWTRDQIIEWLKDVVTKLPDNQPFSTGTLTRFAKFIEALSLPTGELLFGVDKRADWPPHHFARKREDLKKDVKRFVAWRQAFTDHAIWNHYDALGYFLMGAGRAPDQATKANFYMPLTAMYGQWCMKLGGHADDDKSYYHTQLRVGRRPTLFQCTWLTKGAAAKEGTKHPFRFSLGASFAGCDFSESKYTQILNSDWRQRLINMRVGELQKCSLFPTGAESTWPKTAATGSAWGNCGEVYPFCVILSAAGKPQDANGLAIQKSWLEKNTAYDEKTLMASQCVWAPCLNCQWVFSYRWDNTVKKNEEDKAEVYVQYQQNWRPWTGMARARQEEKE